MKRMALKRPAKDEDDRDEEVAMETSSPEKLSSEAGTETVEEGAKDNRELKRMKVKKNTIHISYYR